MGRLAGRLALVTGAAAGIGQAYASRLAAEGARIVIADRAPADDTVAAIADAGGTAVAYACDVGEPDAVAGLREAVVADHGAVDVLVHNAGIYPITDFADIAFAEWRAVMAVNVDGLFLVTQAFLPAMRKGGWGRIVAMASTAFHAGVPGFVHYVASKGAVIGFVRSLAPEVAADGITVNAIAPSLVRTKGTTEGPHEALGQFELVSGLQAIRRTQRPEDLVGALAFLASEEAAFITGQTLVVDGGFVRV